MFVHELRTLIDARDRSTLDDGRHYSRATHLAEHVVVVRSFVRSFVQRVSTRVDRRDGCTAFEPDGTFVDSFVSMLVMNRSSFSFDDLRWQLFVSARRRQ
jgi:hypothetical protein